MAPAKNTASIAARFKIVPAPTGMPHIDSHWPTHRHFDEPYALLPGYGTVRHHLLYRTRLDNSEHRQTGKTTGKEFIMHPHSVPEQHASRDVVRQFRGRYVHHAGIRRDLPAPGVRRVVN